MEWPKGDEVMKLQNHSDFTKKEPLGNKETPAQALRYNSCPGARKRKRIFKRFASWSISVDSLRRRGRKKGPLPVLRQLEEQPLL